MEPLSVTHRPGLGLGAKGFSPLVDRPGLRNEQLLEQSDGVAVRHARDEVARRDIEAVLVHGRSEEHTSELQSLRHLVCRLLLEKKKKKITQTTHIDNQ